MAVALRYAAARGAKSFLLQLKSTDLRALYLPCRPDAAAQTSGGEKGCLLRAAHEPGLVLQNIQWPDMHPAPESVNITGFSPSKY